MLIGDPDKFAFLIEKVPEWSAGGFVNGLLYVYVNGEMFPKELRTTTLSTDLFMLRSFAFDDLPNDERLYALSDGELFGELRRLRYPNYFTDNEDADEDYRFDLELPELGDCGYHIFAVSGGEKVRVLIGHWSGDEFTLVNSAEISLAEFEKIRGAVIEYGENLK